MLEPGEQSWQLLLVELSGQAGIPDQVDEPTTSVLRGSSCRLRAAARCRLHT